jgi:hypothetical protein
MAVQYDSSPDPHVPADVYVIMLVRALPEVSPPLLMFPRCFV